MKQTTQLVLLSVLALTVTSTPTRLRTGLRYNPLSGTPHRTSTQYVAHFENGLLHRDCSLSEDAEKVCGKGHRCASWRQTIEKEKFVECDGLGSCCCYGPRRPCKSSDNCNNGYYCAIQTETKDDGTSKTDKVCVMCDRNNTVNSNSTSKTTSVTTYIDEGKCDKELDPEEVTEGLDPEEVTEGPDPEEVTEGPDPEEVTKGPDPEEVTEGGACIAKHALSQFAPEDLIYSSHRRAAVLCDEAENCATPGHIVIFNNHSMMMKNYCSQVHGGCKRTVMEVNSPKMKKRLRVDSKSPGLQFTALSANHETTFEERVMKLMILAWA